MAKKWAIREGKPIKVRVVDTKENDSNQERVVNRSPRVRIISRIVKLAALLLGIAVGASCR